MVQTRSRAQSRPNSRRPKSIPNPSSSKSTPNTEEFTQQEEQIDSIEIVELEHNDVFATPNHSLPKSVYTDDDQEEEGLGESDKLQLAGIIDSISNDVVPTNLPIVNWEMDSGVANEQDLEEESSDSDEEDVTDDNIKIEKELELELEQESIEYDSEEEGLNEEIMVIHFNDKGQPIGEGVGPFANKVGKITRKHIPVSYAKWREVPGKTIDAVWKRITDKYIIPVAYKHNIVAKICTSWKKYKSMLRAKHYDSYCTDEERKRNCPKNVKQDDWNKFVDNQSTPAAQAQRLRGKKARQAMKTPHFSGRYGAARVADAMKKKNPSGSISRTEVYVALHSRADGSCTEEVEKIKAIAMENPSSINLDVDHDPVAQVRGPEQNGKAIRGLGCGVSKASLRYSAPAIHHLQQERGLRIAAEKKLVEVGVNVDSPNSVEACSLGQIQNTPILRKRKSISEPRNSSDEATPSGKRIREFEDDNSDLNYEDEEDGGGVSSEEESETEFMESVADDIPSGSNIEKRVIQFNEKGQPVGEGSTSFATELGKIARKHCPVSYDRWKAVPSPTRDTLWKLAGDKYIVPDIYKVKVLKIMYLAWKKYKSQLRTKCYDAHSTDEERKRNRPKDIKQVIWNKFVDNESSPAAQALRQLGRIARQSMKTPHVSGRTGAARTAEALKKKNPSGTVTRTDVYVAIHSRPDGSCPTPELTEKLEKIKAIAKEKPDSVNLDIDHDPVAQVLGRGRSGPVRGLGFGVSRLSVIHSAPVMLRLEEERRLRIAAEEKISGLKKKSIHHDPAPKEVRTSHPSAAKKDWTHPSAPKEDRRSHSSAAVEDRRFHPSDPEEDERAHLFSPVENRRSYPSAPVEARRSHLCAKPKIVIPPMKKTKFYAPLDFVLPEADEEISGSNCREEVDLADDVRRKRNVSAEEELAILKQQVKSQKEQIGELQQEREVVTELRKQILSQGLMIADMKELFARLTS